MAKRRAEKVVNFILVGAGNDAGDREVFGDEVHSTYRLAIFYTS